MAKFLPGPDIVTRIEVECAKGKHTAVIVNGRKVYNGRSAAKLEACLALFKKALDERSSFTAAVKTWERQR